MTRTTPTETDAQYPTDSRTDASRSRRFDDGVFYGPVDDVLFVADGTPATHRHIARDLHDMTGVGWVQTVTGGAHQICVKEFDGVSTLAAVIGTVESHDANYDVRKDGDDVKVWIQV